MTNFQRFGDLSELQMQIAPISKHRYENIFFFWSLKGKFAYDVETEAIIWKSRGRRRLPGTRYTVHIPNGKLAMNDLNGTGKEYQGVFSFIANDNTEAIEKADALFPKKYEKFARQRDAGTLSAPTHFVGTH